MCYVNAPMAPSKRRKGIPDRGKLGPHGLYPRNYPRSVRWRVDHDETLGELLKRPENREARQWYADFLNRHYGANFTYEPEGDEWSTEERRAAYRAKNVANDDAYSLTPEEMREEFEPEHLPPMDPEGPPDLSPTPEYLNSPEYKAALAKFRATLAPGRREVKPKPTRNHARARSTLERLVDDAD